MTAQRGLGLYVHWPFCQAKCPYCDFNSHVVEEIDQKVWRDAFCAEIRRAHLDAPDRILSSIFFGGGTPSLMEPETVDAILSEARRSWSISNDIEITLEANPTSVEASRFQEYASAGVNRVSVGVQSLRDHDLRLLGRLHSVNEATKAIEIAKSVFPRVSFDLIYARQGQSLSDWESELLEAIALADGHLSLYQLTIEPGTAFAARAARGMLRGLPDDDLSADMLCLTQELTQAAGLAAYEISNHASEDNESRHNLIYWRGHDWLGVGPGAHGRFDLGGERIATECHLSPIVWLNAAREGNGESRRYTLFRRDALEERLMMGLRLTEGILTQEFPSFSNKFNYLIEIGVLEFAGDRVRTTNAGRPVLNAVLRELLA